MQATVTKIIDRENHSMSVDILRQSDEDLVRHTCEGDRDAFNELVRRYCKPLTEFASFRMGTVQDAEDIAQETLLRAYLNLKSFKTEYSLKNWLFTIAYRLIVSQYRKKKPGQLNEQMADSIASEPETKETNNNWLWKLAEQLNPEDRDILWFRYKQDMGIDEIAGVIGKNKIAARVHLHRARKRLARQIRAFQKQSGTFADADFCAEGI